ncbi:A disintegrin and metalloproteinase with thrombospondin motifs 19-like isoform X2 [Oscarella lobularis]|uniref:A disintegrin and metalloproteinase with thrombospondin motifs 19-like isoform X2 n=1 Tax=Oscarella lobularis TaxID=121494 RepID=UPI003314421E
MLAPAVLVLFVVLVDHKTDAHDAEVYNLDGRQVRTARQTHVMWSEWGAWGKCSFPCNTGVRRRDRFCVVPSEWAVDNHRRMTYVKRYCNHHSEYKVCNRQKCPAGDDFSHNSCSKYNGAEDHWMPYTRMEAPPCLAYCYKVGGSKLIRVPVPDGTECKHKSSTKGVCIANQCKPLGCDEELDSLAQLDACGVCNGNGQDCEIMNKTELYQANFGALGRYVKAVLIPTGSRSIHVEKTCADQYLALMESSGTYCINGERQIGSSKIIQSAGTTVKYIRHGAKEMIDADGPTTSQLTVSMLSIQQSKCNISYNFAVSKENMTKLQSKPATESIPGTSRKVNEEAAANPLPCPKKCSRVTNRAERYCSSDYVVRGRVNSRRTWGFHFRYQIQVIEVYKGGQPDGNIYSENLCDCPNLKPGKTYLIMGSHHEDAGGVIRWMVGAEDYVKPWRDSVSQRLSKLSRRCK